jgi:hypothetical protein
MKVSEIKIGDKKNSFIIDRMYRNAFVLFQAFLNLVQPALIGRSYGLEYD